MATFVLWFHSRAWRLWWVLHSGFWGAIHPSPTLSEQKLGFGVKLFEKREQELPSFLPWCFGSAPLVTSLAAQCPHPISGDTVLCKCLVELLERCFSYHSCDAALGANCDSFGGGSTVWMCRPQKVLIWGMYFSRELHFPFPILSSGESTFSGCELDLSLGLHLLQVRSLILSLGAPYFIALRFFRTTIHSVSFTENAFYLLSAF